MSNHPEEKTGLSDFFSVLSEEKGKARKKFEERIDDPATGISSLFNKLNDALTEVQKPTLHPEDLSEDKILSSDDQKKIAVFSNLVHSFDSEEEIPEEIEIKIEESLPELIVEPLMDREPIVQSEGPPKEIVKTDSIIGEIVNTLDEMGGRTEVKEEIDQITALRRDFDKFRTLIQRDISKREMSGAGSGEVRLEFLDDVDRDTAKVNNKYLKYNSTTGKWAGADASGGGSTSDEDIQDVVGAMFTSNTETGITVTYEDGDGTIDLVVGTLNQDTTGLAGTATALATARTIGGTSFDGTANIAVSLAATATALASARTIHGVSFDGTANIDLTEVVQDTVGAMFSSNTETGITVTYQDGDGTVDLVIGTLNQDTTGLAGTATALATARTIGGTSFDGTANIAVALAATATALASARTIHGVSFDGTANIDLSEVISDTVGAMFSSNTETGVTVTYQDSDNTIDVVVGTLNQDTTGNAATATALATARTIGGTSFDGTANIAVALSATATALASARTIHGVSFDGTANIDLTEVVQDTVGAMFGSNTETGITVTYEDGDGTIDLVVGTLNQDTTGNAATATALETARTIGGTSFDGSANIAVALSATATALATGRTIGMTGDVVWTSASFDGSGNVTGTATIQANSVALGTDTTGNYVATIAGTSNEIEVSGSGSETAGVTIGLPDDVTIGGNLTVTGNYTVNGTTTTIATTNTLLEDNLIELNTGASTNANDSGLLIERGSTGDNAIIMWDESADKFQVGTTTATASDTGNLSVTTGTLIANIEGDVTGDVTGNASTATTLESARTIHGVSFNGSANIDLTEEIQDTVGAMFGSNTETGITVTYEDGDGTIDLVVGTLNQDTTGLAGTATALATARTIGGTSFDGTANIAVALAATATALASARTIHGVSFDGTANIDLTEVVQDTVGAMFSSNTETGVTVSYEDGDGTIDLVVGTLNQDTTGTAAIATTVTITDNESTNESNALIFTAGGDVDGGNLGLESDGTLTYNPSTGKITATGFIGALTGDVTGNVTGNTSGTAATVTTAAQSAITSLGSLTGLTVAGDSNITGHASVGASGVTDATRTLTVVGASDGTGSSIIVGYNSSLAAKFSVRDDGYTAIGAALNVTGTVTSTGLDVNSSGTSTIDSSGEAFYATTSGAATNVARIRGTHASYTGNIVQPWSVRAASTAFDFIECIANDGSDVPFRIRGDGQVTSSAGATFAGNAGIGTVNAPSNKNTVTPTLNVLGSGVAGAAQITRHTTVGGGGALLHLAGTRGSDVNSYTILQDGDGIGTVAFQAADGNEFATAAQIVANVDGTPGDNDMPGRLSFQTTADGASSPTERIRITSAGIMEVTKDQDIDHDIGRSTIGTFAQDWANFSHIDHSGAAGAAFRQSAAGKTEINTPAGQSVAFRIGNVDKMYMNASGSFGIGTTSPAQKLTIDTGFTQHTNGYGLIWGGDAYIKGQGDSSQYLLFNAGGSGSQQFQTGGTERMRIDGDGHITAPYQSGFYATCAALANKTGNGTTTYIVGSAGYTWTEAEDNNADFDGAGLFTAPVDGFYHLSGTMGFSGLNGATSGVGYLIVSNGNIQILHNPTSISNVSVNYNLNISQVVYMDANDTAQMAMYINGAGSDVCDLDSAQFSGYLLG